MLIKDIFSIEEETTQQNMLETFIVTSFAT